jgi:hypothetical protein
MARREIAKGLEWECWEIARARGRNPGTVSMVEDYDDGTSMVLGEGKKPSGEEVSVRLLLLALLEDQGQTNNLMDRVSYHIL